GAGPERPKPKMVWRTDDDIRIGRTNVNSRDRTSGILLLNFWKQFKHQRIVKRDAVALHGLHSESGGRKSAHALSNVRLARCLQRQPPGLIVRCLSLRRIENSIGPAEFFESHRKLMAGLIQH